MGTILGILDNLKLFWFFENISKTRPSMEHWGNFFFENINPKHVQNTFGHFWERFRDFCNFENLFFFWKHFEVSTLHGTLGKKNFSKSTPKHVQNAFGQFGNDFGRFCNFDIFLIFWKPFEHSTFHRTLRKKSFSKKVSQDIFKTLLDSLGTILYVFGILNFLNNISKTRPSMEHWAKKVFRKKYLQNLFKILLDNLGTILGIFGFLKVFGFFENISKTRPSMQHWAKRNFRKKYPDTCSKHFWTIWERF